MGIQLIRCISEKESACNFPVTDDPIIGKYHTVHGCGELCDQYFVSYMQKAGKIGHIDNLKPFLRDCLVLKYLVTSKPFRMKIKLKSDVKAEPQAEIYTMENPDKLRSVGFNTILFK